MNHARPLSRALVAAVCCLTGSGCGGGENVVPVSGIATHNGQPVSGIVVSFVPDAANGTGVSTGTTDENGKYELTVAKTGKSGVVVGTHKVWVSLPREPFVEPADKEVLAKAKKDKKAASAAKSPADLAEILKKYGSSDKSPLTVEVKGGGPIDLKLD